MFLLSTAENTLRDQQNRLETQALAYLQRGERRAAARYLRQALDTFDQRWAYVANEQQQIFLVKERVYLVARFLEVSLQLQDWAAALELVERTKSRAFLSVLGLTPLHRPADSSALEEREKTLLAEARQVTAAAWACAAAGDGEHGFELWGQSVSLRRELEDIWAQMEADAAWAEYVSLRRGTAPDLQQMRDCLR